MTSDDVRKILTAISNSSKTTWGQFLLLASMLMGEILLVKISARERLEEIQRESKTLPDAPGPTLPHS